VAVQPSAGNHPVAVATGDFNGDARVDLAIANYGTNPSGSDLGDVRVLLAQANNTFQSSIVCRPPAGAGAQVGAGPMSLISRDLNGDQKLDLAFANFLTDNISVCLGSGNGDFTLSTVLPGGSGPTDLVAVDIDGDSDADLLVTNGKSRKSASSATDSAKGTRFEPAESFGAATFLGVTRIALPRPI
jgi:hypothetical protein